jgi:hypothetical protein
MRRALFIIIIPILFGNFIFCFSNESENFEDNIDSTTNSTYYYTHFILSGGIVSYKDFIGDDSYDLVLKNLGLNSNNNYLFLYGFGVEWNLNLEQNNIITRFLHDANIGLKERLFWQMSDEELKGESKVQNYYEKLIIYGLESGFSYSFFDVFNFEYTGGFNFLTVYCRFSRNFSQTNIDIADTTYKFFTESNIESTGFLFTEKFGLTIIDQTLFKNGPYIKYSIGISYKRTDSFNFDKWKVKDTDVQINGLPSTFAPLDIYELSISFKF